MQYILFFSDSIDDVLFTNLKWHIIEKYLNLDDHGKDMVDTVLTKEYARCKTALEVENIKASPSLVRDPDADYLKPQAAHARTDMEVTDEMIQNDDDIMNDENF